MAKIPIKKSNPRQLFDARMNGKTCYILMERGKVKSVSYERPVLIEVFPSLTCNLSCPTCDRGTETSMLEDLRDIKKLFDNFSASPEFRLLSFRISGREPTLYPKINELISFLHRLDPFAEVEFFTNAIELRRLNKKSLSVVRLRVSIYPETQNLLEKDRFIRKVFESKGLPLRVNEKFHEDLSRHGRIPNDHSPLAHCFNPVLLCGTQKVYPCCRAHKFEQMHKSNYHYHVSTKNLYRKLKKIIQDTDLCRHCPRLYKDRVMVPIRHSRKTIVR